MERVLDWVPTLVLVTIRMALATGRRSQRPLGQQFICEQANSVLRELGITG